MVLALVMRRKDEWEFKNGKVLECCSPMSRRYFVTRNFLLLFSISPGVFAVTNPVVAPLGTTAVRYVSETILNLSEGSPLKKTPVVPMNPCPRMPMDCPALPESGH
jgi:hypothetical protein